MEKDHLLPVLQLSISPSVDKLGKMQPTAAASTERSMRQKVKIDPTGSAESDAKKKKHGHTNISPAMANDHVESILSETIAGKEVSFSTLDVLS